MENPEQAAHDERLRRMDLSSLASSLEEYNRDHGMGRLAAETILSGLPLEDREEEVRSRPPKLSPEELRNRHREEMDAMGLSVEPVGGHAVIFGSEEQPSVMRVNLHDGRKFVAYLQLLNAEQLSDSQRMGLQKVVENLKLQLEEQYDLEDQNDERMLELFAVLGDVVAEYQRLGEASKEIAGLQEYLTVARSRYLKEFLMAKNGRLLDKVGTGFGPSTWQRDITPERYEAKWLGVLDLVKEIRRNPQTAEFCTKVIDNLRKSLDFAEQDLENVTHLSPEEKALIKGTIIKYRSKTADL